jgi:hypothetical protein
MFDILPEDNLPLRAAVIAQTRKWVFRHPKVDEVKHLLGDDPTADEQALDQAIVSSIRDLFACLRNSTQYNTLQGWQARTALLVAVMGPELKEMGMLTNAANRLGVDRKAAYAAAKMRADNDVTKWVGRQR